MDLFGTRLRSLYMHMYREKVAQTSYNMSQTSNSSARSKLSLAYIQDLAIEKKREKTNKYACPACNPPATFPAAVLCSGLFGLGVVDWLGLGQVLAAGTTCFFHKTS